MDKFEKQVTILNQLISSVKAIPKRSFALGAYLNEAAS